MERSSWLLLLRKSKKSCAPGSKPRAKTQGQPAAALPGVALPRRPPRFSAQLFIPLLCLRPGEGER